MTHTVLPLPLPLHPLPILRSTSMYILPDAASTSSLDGSYDHLTQILRLTTLSLLRKPDSDNPCQTIRRSDLYVVLLSFYVHGSALLYTLLRGFLSGYAFGLRAMQ